MNQDPTKEEDSWEWTEKPVEDGKTPSWEDLNDGEHPKSYTDFTGPTGC